MTIETSANKSSKTGAPKNRTSRTKAPVDRRDQRPIPQNKTTPPTPESLTRQTTQDSTFCPAMAKPTITDADSTVGLRASPTTTSSQDSKGQRSRQLPRAEPTPPRRSGRQRFVTQCPPPCSPVRTKRHDRHLATTEKKRICSRPPQPKEDGRQKIHCFITLATKTSTTPMTNNTRQLSATW